MGLNEARVFNIKNKPLYLHPCLNRMFLRGRVDGIREGLGISARYTPQPHHHHHPAAVTALLQTCNVQTGFKLVIQCIFATGRNLALKCAHLPSVVLSVVDRVAGKDRRSFFGRGGRPAGVLPAGDTALASTVTRGANCRSRPHLKMGRSSPEVRMAQG